MMRLRKFAAMMCLGGAFILASAQTAPPRDLRTLSHELEATYHLHGEHVPMTGAASGFAGAFAGFGVRGMQVVTYEDLPDGLDRAAVGKLVRTHLVAAWSLLVRDSSGKDGEEDMVWMQPAGKRVRLLVVDLDGTELNLVQMELNPDQLQKWQAEHGE